MGKRLALGCYTFKHGWWMIPESKAAGPQPHRSEFTYIQIWRVQSAGPVKAMGSTPVTDFHHTEENNDHYLRRGAQELLTGFKDPLAPFLTFKRSIRKNSDSIKEDYPSRGCTALAHQHSRNSDEGADRRRLWQPTKEHEPRWQAINVKQRIWN